MAEKHTILGGKVHVYKRDRSSVWQCSTYLEGKNRRVSTKEESLAKAKEFAEDWYLGLRGKKARGELLSEMTFAQAADRFTKEYELMTAGGLRLTAAVKEIEENGAGLSITLLDEKTSHLDKAVSSMLASKFTEKVENSVVSFENGKALVWLDLTDTGIRPDEANWLSARCSERQ